MNSAEKLFRVLKELENESVVVETLMKVARIEIKSAYPDLTGEEVEMLIIQNDVCRIASQSLVLQSKLMAEQERRIKDLEDLVHKLDSRKKRLF